MTSTFQDSAEFLFFVHVISLTLFIFALMANLRHSGISWFSDEEEKGNLLVQMIGLAILAIDFFVWIMLSRLFREVFGLTQEDSTNWSSFLITMVEALYFLYIYHFYNHFLGRDQRK